MARLVNVVCVGDSLTEGGYPTILQDLLSSHETSCNWRVEKWAVIGSSTKDWLQQHLAGSALQRFAKNSVDVFVLMLGTNDCQRQIQMAQPFRDSEFQQRLMQIAKILMNQGAPVILMTPPPVDAGGSFGTYIDAGLVNGLTRIYQQAAAALKCPLADAFSALGGVRPNRQAFVDGCHLSPEGNRLVANAVMQTILCSVMSTGSNLGDTPTNKVAAYATPDVSPSAKAASPKEMVPLSPKMAQRSNLPQQPTSVQQPATVVAKMPRAAAMPLRADGYSVGAAVEVWSQSWDSWFTGRITKTDGSSVLAEFVAPDGKEKEKWMPIDHPHLRPATSVSVQASPGLTASAVNLISPMQSSRVTNTITSTNTFQNVQSMKTQTTMTQTPSVPPVTSSSAFNGSVSLGSSRGSIRDSLRWTAGQSVEYRSRRDQQWYRGTVQNVDASGCLLMLDVGILKSVPMQDAPNRLRSVTSFGKSTSFHSAGSSKAINSYYSGSTMQTRL